MTAIASEGRQMIRSFVDHEHDELAAGMDRLHEVAWELPSLAAPQRTTKLRLVLHWIEEMLRPHMAWEETWLFPRIDDRAETRWATHLVRFDHRQIAQQADRLGVHRAELERGPTGDAVTQVRCDLFGLEALLRANLEREETFMLPLLEAEGMEWMPEWRD
jgi:hypothetical protein